MGTQGNGDSLMAKTTLSPEVLGQLKKLFAEVIGVRNATVEVGRVTLQGGRATITLSRRYADFHPFLTPHGTTPANYYTIEKSWNNKFIIHSSDANDTSDMEWMVIGG